MPGRSGTPRRQHCGEAGGTGQPQGQRARARWSSVRTAAALGSGEVCGTPGSRRVHRSQHEGGTRGRRAAAAEARASAWARGGGWQVAARTGPGWRHQHAARQPRQRHAALRHRHPHAAAQQQRASSTAPGLSCCGTPRLSCCTLLHHATGSAEHQAGTDSTRTWAAAAPRHRQPQQACAWAARHTRGLAQHCAAAAHCRRHRRGRGCSTPPGHTPLLLHHATLRRGHVARVRPPGGRCLSAHATWPPSPHTPAPWQLASRARARGQHTRPAQPHAHPSATTRAREPHSTAPRTQHTRGARYTRTWPRTPAGCWGSVHAPGATPGSQPRGRRWAQHTGAAQGRHTLTRVCAVAVLQAVGTQTRRRTAGAQTLTQHACLCQGTRWHTHRWRHVAVADARITRRCITRAATTWALWQSRRPLSRTAARHTAQGAGAGEARDAAGARRGGGPLYPAQHPRQPPTRGRAADTTLASQAHSSLTPRWHSNATPPRHCRPPSR